MKRFFVVIVCNFFAVLLYGQLSSFSSQNQQLIEDVVKDGIFIVNRRYQLQDITSETPAYYGRQNQNYFGENYSLGIRVKEGYYLSDKAVRPWIYDPNFEQYAESNKLKPVLSGSEFRMLEDTIKNALPFRDVLMEEISTQNFYLAQDTTLFHQKGFSVDCTDGMKKGWLVWIVFDKPLEEQIDQTPAFLIYRSELTFEQEIDSSGIKKPATDKHILGGFFFQPEFTDIGHVVFYLTGILHYETDKWQIIRLGSSNTVTQSHSVEEERLTPVNRVNQ